MMAILHTLLNLNQDVQVGDDISSWREFFKNISARDRGEAIASMNDLLKINNSYDVLPHFLLRKQQQPDRLVGVSFMGL